MSTPPEACWYYTPLGERADAEKVGPVPFSEIEMLVGRGALTEGSLLWEGDSKDPLYVWQVASLADRLRKKSNMQWYFAAGATKVGPLSEAEVLQEVKSGRISVGTLVWHDGLTRWAPAETILPAYFPQVDLGPPPLPGEALQVQLNAPSSSPNSPPISADVLAQISEPWRTRFDLIDKCGGFNGNAFLPDVADRKKIRELGFLAPIRLAINIWAFLFGPFYYFAKGMWRRGLSLCAIGLLLSKLIDNLGFHAASMTSASALFMLRANMDYYRKVVLNDNGWL